MLRSLRPRSVYDVLGAIGYFAALATGGAYAANTIGSSDVIDESLLSQDLKNGTVALSDLGSNSVGFDEIRPSNVFSSDIADGTITAADAQAGAFVRPCQPGSVPGYAWIVGSSSFQSTPGTSGIYHKYNCTGQTIRAVRTGIGAYEVVFDGLQHFGALATGNADAVGAFVRTGRAIDLTIGGFGGWAPGTIGYSIFISELDGSGIDVPFVLAVYPQRPT
jgi:hypothetical protein